MTSEEAQRAIAEKLAGAALSEGKPLNDHWLAREHWLAVAREAMRMMERVAHAYLVAAEISDPDDRRRIDLSPALEKEP